MKFVIFGGEDALVAVCLERYIGAQGRDMEEVTERLQTAYRAERDDTLARTGVPFGDIPPAPEKYHKMWEDNGPGVTRGTIVAEPDAELRLAA